jgi:hypothetical protein
MQVEDPAPSGGAEQRRLRRIYEAQGAGRKAQGKNECFLCFLLSLCLEPYALSREIEERSLARLWREGNTARQIPSPRGDDALMVDQGSFKWIATKQKPWYGNQSGG